MKHDVDQLNLRSAFGTEPEECHAALMAAVRSVEEEKKTPRPMLRTLVIAAALLLCMTAAAFAATQSGLLDWLAESMGAQAPASAGDVLSATKKASYEVGPLTMTVSETLADGRLAYLTVSTACKDGASALICEGSGDPYDPVGAAQAAALNHPDITADTPMALAARKTGLPLYSVMAWLQLDDDVRTGEEMMDALRLEDGSVLLINMLNTDPQKVSDTLDAYVYLRVRQLDPATLETVGDLWQTVEQRILTIHGVTNQRTYTPQGDPALNSAMTLTSVKAEQTCAGVYVTVYVDTPDGMPGKELMESAFDLLQLLDENGEPFPDGISLSYSVTTATGGELYTSSSVYALRFEMMIGVDALPERITVNCPNGRSVTVE